MELVAHLPVHYDFLGGTVIQILIGDGINGVSDSLNHRVQLVLIADPAVNINLQRLFFRAEPEKGNGLLNAVTVQILELDRLDIFTGEGGDIFSSLVPNFFDFALERPILRRRLGHGIELVHRAEKTARQQRQHSHQQEAERYCVSFHLHQPPPEGLPP